MGKPAIAFASEAKARENLDRKLMRLKALLERGATAADAPASLNQFNAWTFDGDAVDRPFISNAHETLTRHSDLKAAAVALVRLVRMASKPVRPQRELSLRRSKEQAELHKRIRQIAERHAVQMIQENADLRREKLALVAQVESMANEVESIRRSFEEQLQKLRERNAELVRSQSEKIKIFGKRE